MKTGRKSAHVEFRLYVSQRFVEDRDEVIDLLSSHDQRRCDDQGAEDPDEYPSVRQDLTESNAEGTIFGPRLSGLLIFD